MKLGVFIDLGRIRRNITDIRRNCGAGILLMVKADGYGHGMIRVAKSVENSVDMFGVATVEEGLELRSAGISKDILVAAVAENEIEEAAEAKLTLAVIGAAQAKAVAKKYSQGNISAPKVHIKIDTGMRRLGIMPSELDDVLATLTQAGIKPEGVYSHLRSQNKDQPKAFSSVAGKIRAEHPECLLHLASSNSVMNPELAFDMVRIGRAAYEGAMTVVGEVLESRRVCAGECVSYGDFALAHDTNIAVVFGGYADGVAREHPSEVLIRGRRCKPVGRVCMDMFAVDTGDFLASSGETVILQNEELSADKLAEQRDTIGYTVMTGWRGRVRRIYFDDQGGGEAAR